MKLYELTNDFAQLFDQFDEISSMDNAEEFKQAWFDTLSGIEEEFEVKAENIGAYIKELTAAAKYLKAEEEVLSKRRRAKEKQAEWLKKYLLESMQDIGRTKIDRPMAVLSIRTNPESVRFDDENAFITLCQRNGSDDYLRYKAPEINRSAVKEALQAGQKIEGASLIRTQTVTIK